ALRGLLPFFLLPIFLLAFGISVGCEEPDLSLPSPADVEKAYTYGGGLSVTMNGNVAEITIVQADRQLRRGGTLWAKVGPFILLFSKETEALFMDYPGLAGVRAVTVTPDGAEVARALLARDALNGLTWRRALNIAGLARRDGTRRPTLLEDLVEWGEDHTQFDYSPRFSRP
ncbi:MAG: hypothetical protein ABIF09_12410, partial [Gemmatimonadota bacterium]